MLHDTIRHSTDNDIDYIQSWLKNDGCDFKCNLPEIDWCAKPRYDQVEIDCRACGHNTMLSSQKNKKIFDKMVGYICTEAEKGVKKSTKKVMKEVMEATEEPHYGIDDGKWSDEM